MLWKFGLAIIFILQVFSYIECIVENEEDISPLFVEDPDEILTLYENETRIVDHITHKRYSQAEDEILNLYPNLRHFRRMKFIFHNAMENNVIHLKDFVHMCQNNVIKYNALYVLYLNDRYDKPIKFSLVETTFFILSDAVRDNDFRKYADLILKDLLEVDKHALKEIDDNIIWNVAKKFLQQHVRNLSYMDYLFDQNGVRNQTSIILERNKYFTHILKVLNILHPEERSEAVFIKNGEKVIAATENGTIVITGYHPRLFMNSKWFIEPLDFNSIYIKQFKTDKYLCLKGNHIDGGNVQNELVLGSRYSHACAWKLKQAEDFYYIYIREFISIYLCSSGFHQSSNDEEEIPKSCNWNFFHSI